MYDPQKHYRKSIRLKGYDYSNNGAYFVTICTQDRALLFGDIQDGTMHMSPAGRMVMAHWEDIPNQFSDISLDCSMLMPNHFHAVLLNLGEENRPILGDIIGAFKSKSTVAYIRGIKNKGWNPFNKRLWQRNYWEHIIRNEQNLIAIREYILNNPINWKNDKLHPTKPEFPSKL